jgi:hypothetical protein
MLFPETRRAAGFVDVVLAGIAASVIVNIVAVVALFTGLHDAVTAASAIGSTSIWRARTSRAASQSTGIGSVTSFTSLGMVVSATWDDRRVHAASAYAGIARA